MAVVQIVALALSFVTTTLIGCNGRDTKFENAVEEPADSNRAVQSIREGVDTPKTVNK